MVTTARSKLAPVSASARRMARKTLGRRATDREIEKMFRGWCEWRDIPTKLDVLDNLMHTAWAMVHKLTDSGVKFAGNARQATLVIAGTAYAGWRGSLPRAGIEHNSDPAAVVARAFDHGVEFAQCYKAGIPWMYAADFAAAVECSDDPIDRMTPLSALARLWPDRYTTTSIRFRRPKYASDQETWADDFWAVCPNILTAPRKELRRATAPKIPK